MDSSLAVAGVGLEVSTLESDVVRFCTHLAVLRSHCFTAGDFLVHHAIALGLVLRTYWPAYRFSRCL